MNLIKKYVFDYKGENVLRQSIIWNMIGSIVYAIISMTLGMIVIKCTDLNLGGLVFFAFSTLGQQVYIIASYGIRPIHITDTAKRYSFFEYAFIRFFMCLISLLSGGIYLFFTSYRGEEYIIVLTLIIYKIVDAFCDLYECELQRNGYLFISGKSLTIRSLVSSLLFILCLIFTKNLIISSFVFVISLLVCMFFISRYALIYTNKIRSDYEYEENKKIDFDNIKIIFMQSLSLFLATFIDFYIFSISKYFMEKNFASDLYAIYSLLFLPASIINLMAGFIIRPALTILSDLYNKGDFIKFRKKSFNIGVIIAGMILTGAIPAYFIGIDILALFFDEVYNFDIYSYRMMFSAIIFGGGLYAMSNFIYYLLVIKRKEKFILYSYILCVIFAYPITRFAVAKCAMSGAGYSFAITMLLLIVIEAVFYLLSGNDKFFKG